MPLKPRAFAIDFFISFCRHLLMPYAIELRFTPFHAIYASDEELPHLVIFIAPPRL
jgi:hypothetical protein